MSFFTTRVELHKAATPEDYKTLHTEMENAGFSRTIRLEGESVSYHLPTAEYNYNKTNSNLDAAGVLELAKKAAAKTGRAFSVLVTKADGRRYWHNLEPVK
jgi:hypothetical protein